MTGIDEVASLEAHAPCARARASRALLLMHASGLETTRSGSFSAKIDFFNADGKLVLAARRDAFEAADTAAFPARAERAPSVPVVASLSDTDAAEEEAETESAPGDDLRALPVVEQKARRGGDSFRGPGSFGPPRAGPL